MAVLAATSETIERAARVLREGGVVAIPTETVYGLAANAFDPEAVARVFEIKRRPAFDPLIVHVFDDAMLANVARDVPQMARDLMKRFWPGPLTLVLSKAPALPSLVTAGLETVGVRMPSHPVARALLECSGLALAAPSANPFGQLSPTRAAHVEAALGDRVDLILEGGPCEHGLESSIVLIADPPVLLRPGAVEPEAIERVTGRLERLTSGDAVLAPGTLPQHYAPRTPIAVVDFSTILPPDRAAAGALAFQRAPSGYREVRVLSPSGDLREAAAHLFDMLHELDAAGVERIDAERVPERGLGIAIADRLARATTSA